MTLPFVTLIYKFKENFIELIQELLLLVVTFIELSCERTS
jgi:hypothetical protein